MQSNFASRVSQQFRSQMPRNVVPHRQWQCSSCTQFSLNDYSSRFLNNFSSRVTFSVMSYNILSQKLLKQHMYLYQNSPRDALNWERRRRILLMEIRHHDVDILCLQELEECEYYNTFKPRLSEFGYQSVYKRKTCLKEDGCAIFYKACAFSLAKCVEVEFRRPSEPLLNRDNIGLVALFRPLGARNENVKFCVATTHLLFNPKRGDVKLAQLRLLLAEIDKMAFAGVSSSSAPEYYPVILCGDFNSVPHSPLYNFVTTGNICCTAMLTGDVSGQSEGFNRGSEMPPKCIDLKSLGIDRRCQYVDSTSARSRTCDENPNKLGPPLAAKPGTVTLPDASLFGVDTFVVKGDKRLVPNREDRLVQQPKSDEDVTYYHNFNFSSAYQHIARDGSEEVTSCHSKARCTVDYIFYSQPMKTELLYRDEPDQMGSLLTVQGVYSLFSTEEMDYLGDLPNWAFPSDHMCLIAHFALSST